MDGKRYSCCTTELLEEDNRRATQDCRRSRQQSGKPKAIPASLRSTIESHSRT
jgi:hypothetical protein